MSRRRAVAPAAVLVGLLCGILSAQASATFHLMSIREVYPGSTSAPDAEYVELQMYAPGQNLVEGHQVKTYDANGALVKSTAFPADVPYGEDQRTVLLATPSAEAAFGVVADGTMSPDQLSPAGGAVCWEALDCVSWGSFSGPLPSPAGPPASPAGIPDGMALRRTIAPGCPTALEPGDDHDSAAADFSAVFPAPRPNSASPSERLCPGAESGFGGIFSGGGGSGHGGQAGPRTELKRKPPRRTSDRTPSFGFGASAPQATFQCKLDRRPFRACRSPFTAPPLALGRHVFEVRARASSGKLDGSPARWAFRVVARR
jgi:hypothetical protein